MSPQSPFALSFSDVVPCLLPLFFCPLLFFRCPPFVLSLSDVALSFSICPFFLPFSCTTAFFYFILSYLHPSNHYLHIVPSFSFLSFTSCSHFHSSLPFSSLLFYPTVSSPLSSSFFPYLHSSTHFLHIALTFSFLSFSSCSLLHSSLPFSFLLFTLQFHHRILLVLFLLPTLFKPLPLYCPHSLLPFL